ncbi:MAG: DUF6113 family protein [Nocardioides sp.]
MRRQLARLAAVLAGLLAGVLTSLATIALHRSWWWLACAAVITTAALIRMPLGGWLRMPFAGGWVIVVVGAMVGRPEGDYVLAAEPHGYVVLLGGVAVLVGATVTSVSRGAEPTHVGTLL